MEVRVKKVKFLINRLKKLNLFKTHLFIGQFFKHMPLIIFRCQKSLNKEKKKLTSKKLPKWQKFINWQKFLIGKWHVAESL